MSKRSLTDEEKKLWKQVTQSITPLHPQESEAEIEEGAEEKNPARKTSPKATPVTVVPAKKTTQLGALKQGVYAGVDANNAQRFKKGENTIDATLDLHGMNRNDAHSAIIKFIKTRHAKGARTLLVITGKGKKDSPGLLRDMLPQWLNDEQIRPLVLAYDMAKPKHGGSGAFYVLLKRQRT